MAKWCFSLGIDLKRIEVIADDEEEIMEAVKRMSDRYDFVVTRHDDITYPSIAKAFDLPLKVHADAFQLMKRFSKHRAEPDFSWEVETSSRKSRIRMVELPTDESRDLAKQAIFVLDDNWVPISVVNGNVHILPGVPNIFQSLLEGLKPHIVSRLVDPEGIHRILIATPYPESVIAAYLTGLAAKVEPRGVKVGSYPRWGKRSNTVTLVGRDLAYIESLLPEVLENVKGKRVEVEGEDDEEEDVKAPEK
ncbi:putative molybdopterin binding domain-containing protein [Eutypa lata UCREL1]|uniref:Putative molybdopterin binding domain-containing protein n=1 Tax=Eutypa lata (strain UCR-EL1) TaxID=1287681 RepID=M7T8S2_EUTLA|nr:putative molybdopterin binding domain-containing protein [Eutypa lata UCREL1]